MLYQHHKTISNFKFQISNCEKGFTLVELLASMIVLIAIGTIITTILFASLRGSSKTNSLTNVKQNGNFAITQMGKMIRFAKRFEGMSTDGIDYATSCASIPVGQGTPTPTPRQYKYIKISAFDGGTTIFACTRSPDTISSNSADLIDTKAVSAIHALCYFTCSQEGTSQNPVVGIFFTLSQKTASSFFEQKASVGFQTSVALRNR